MGSEIRVSYQGVPGAYSHLACYGYFGERIEALPSETFERAMERVEEGEADYALIPIENKTAGRVDEFYGLIPEMRLQIVGEHYQRIEHCLIGLPGSSLQEITHVYSHPQGLAQCRNYLNYMGYKPVAKFDTAGSAEEISRTQDRHHAAIASSLAAKTYGLEILQTTIQDQKDNFTRFIVLSNTQAMQSNPNKEYITSIIFEVKNIPSALYKALGGFAKNSVNILKIESYIPLGQWEESHFHIDVDGAIESPQLQAALEELRNYVSTLKILGSYERNPLRTSDEI